MEEENRRRENGTGSIFVIVIRILSRLPLNLVCSTHRVDIETHLRIGLDTNAALVWHSVCV